MVVLLESINLIVTCAIVAAVAGRLHVYRSRNAKSAAIVFVCMLVALRLAHFLVPVLDVSPEMAKSVQGVFGVLASVALFLWLLIAPVGAEHEDLVEDISEKLATKSPARSQAGVKTRVEAQGAWSGTR